MLDTGAKGDLPEGIKQVFRAETEIAGTLTRTVLDGPADVPNVKAVQAGMKLEPLSAFLGRPAPSPAPSIVFPPSDKAKEASPDFTRLPEFLPEVCDAAASE